AGHDGRWRPDPALMRFYRSDPCPTQIPGPMPLRSPIGTPRPDRAGWRCRNAWTRCSCHCCTPRWNVPDRRRASASWISAAAAGRHCSNFAGRAAPGGGATLLDLAGQVGPGGSVLGVDVSAPMLGRARERVQANALAQVRLTLSDAATHAFEPGAFDLAFSRFGVMFFGDPVGAFANIRTALAA